MRLKDELAAYIEAWHKATGRDKEEITNHMIQSYMESVGDPPPPRPMPRMPKVRKR